MLIAQSQAENLTMVSNEQIFDRIWNPSPLVDTPFTCFKSPLPLLIFTSSKAYIDLGVHLSIPL